jgi:hypothetical protein
MMMMIIKFLFRPTHEIKTMKKKKQHRTTGERESRVEKEKVEVTGHDPF